MRAGDSSAPSARWAYQVNLDYDWIATSSRHADSRPGSVLYNRGGRGARPPPNGAGGFHAAAGRCGGRSGPPGAVVLQRGPSTRPPTVEAAATAARAWVVSVQQRPLACATTPSTPLPAGTARPSRRFGAHPLGVSRASVGCWRTVRADKTTCFTWDIVWLHDSSATLFPSCSRAPNASTATRRVPPPPPARGTAPSPSSCLPCLGAQRQPQQKDLGARAARRGCGTPPRPAPTPAAAHDNHPSAPLPRPPRLGNRHDPGRPGAPGGCARRRGGTFN